MAGIGSIASHFSPLTFFWKLSTFYEHCYSQNVDKILKKSFEREVV